MNTRIIAFICTTLLSFNTFSGVLWYCSATNIENTVWNQYGLTRASTQYAVAKKCKPFNNHKNCTIICFPPREYWRCLSHDTVPLSADHGGAKPGTWSWTSYSKQIAINGAKNACRHNSGFGGCYVNPDNCASS